MSGARALVKFSVCRAVLLAVLAVTMLTVSSARAQGMGPPLPEVRDGLLVMPGGEIPERFNALNPLRMLDVAGDALPVNGQFGQASPAVESSGDGAEPRRGGLSTAVQILVVLTVVSLAPSIMLMCTCFVRILVVLGLLKQALGTATIPPPQVITALALLMTLIVMSPTIERINAEAIEPYRAGEVGSYDELWDRAKAPVRDFMFAQIEHTGNWDSVYMILDYRGVDTSDPSALTRADVDMVTLIPAYMLSELKTAFVMGFRVYLPFLVIDLVIATMLISMSMMMLPPVLVSLPFKLLLFVLVDGWTLVVGSLMASFAAGQPEAVVGFSGALQHLAASVPPPDLVAFATRAMSA